jgi:hypothetical protein
MRALWFPLTLRMFPEPLAGGFTWGSVLVRM